jgi:hypothetical protein
VFMDVLPDKSEKSWAEKGTGTLEAAAGMPE